MASRDVFQQIEAKVKGIEKRLGPVVAGLNEQLQTDFRDLVTLARGEQFKTVMTRFTEWCEGGAKLFAAPLTPVPVPSEPTALGAPVRPAKTRARTSGASSTAYDALTLEQKDEIRVELRAARNQGDEAYKAKCEEVLE